MDPDKTLAELRVLMASMDRSVHDGEKVSDTIAQEVVHRFEALDSWLVNRGFLPREWASSVDKGVRS